MHPRQTSPSKPTHVESPLETVAEVLRREADPNDPMTEEAAVKAIGRVLGIQPEAPQDAYQKPLG